jgi:diguanylate cyclase (GGDEF)-like protein
VKLSTEAVQHAKILFAQRSKLIVRQREDQIARLRSAPRGGASQAAIAKAHVDCIESLAKAYAESYVSAYEKSGIPLDKKEIDEIVAEVRPLVDTWFSSARNDPNSARFIGTHTPDSQSIVAEVRQGLILRMQQAVLAEERARRQSSEPRQSVAAEVDVSLDKALEIFDKHQFNRDLPLFVTAGVTKSQPISLAFIDVDQFKEVNDTHGHDVGDRVLQQTVEIMKAASEGKGRCYRWGGDEFTIILPNYTIAEAISLVERIRSRVSESHVEGCPEGFTISAGVAEHMGTDPDADQLFKQADDALLEAKKSGKNQVRAARSPSNGVLKEGPPRTADIQAIVDAVQISVISVEGRSSYYTIDIKNNSGQEVTVKSITLATENEVELMSPAEPEPPGKIPAKSHSPLGFRPDRLPAVKLESMHAQDIHAYRVQGRSLMVTIMVILTCEILGKNKEFRKKVAALLDTNNHYLLPFFG